MEITKELKLEKLDPTGVVVESNSLTYTIDDEETMREHRFALLFGEYIYTFNKHGDLIKKIK